jgi:hypothetical protein
MDIEEAFAEKLLFIWGNQKRARGAGVNRHTSSNETAPYDGNIDAGTYKPEDDPHSHAFVIGIVDKALALLSPRHIAYAGHVYIWRRSPYQFTKARDASRLKSEIVDTLTGHAHCWHDATPARDASEIMQELRALRRLGR